MNGNNAMISRLLDSQPMNPIGQTSIAQPAQTVAGVSDSERRRQEIAAREEARQKKARERLANRQASMEGDARQNQTPMESDDPRSGTEPAPPGYSINDIVGGAQSKADGEMGSLDRKPLSQWSRDDWGKMLVDIGGGFASAKDGSFASGLQGATKGAASNLAAQDKRSQDYDDKLMARKQALEDMLMEDEIRQRRVGDERSYDQGVRRDERDYRSGERQQDRLYEERLTNKRRDQALADRDEERDYRKGEKMDERAYGEKVAIAANARADAKIMRDAAAKNSRDYSSDYVKMATDLNKARIEAGGDPMTSDELDAIIIPQLQRAYGIGTLGGAPQSVLPQNQTLSSGY